MIAGLGTHFDEVIPMSDLTAVYGFGFRWARVDAQLCDVTTMAAMRADCTAAGLDSLVILYDLEKLAELPFGAWVEWGNELDFTMKAREYRQSLNEASEIAETLGLNLVAPCISNLDLDSLRWCEQVRGRRWPAGMVGVSIHRYGDGTFDWSHPGFYNRAQEVEALLDLCDDLPFLVTEFGYKTGTGEGFVTEDQQAIHISQEWAFWAESGAQAAFLYQINDGQAAEEGFGIRRVDGTWKPSAFTVPGGAL